MSIIIHFFQDESGATAIEYGLIAALVVLAAVGAITTFSNATLAMYAVVEAAMLAA